MLDEKLVELLNDQVNKEFYSAYLYLSMANYYNDATDIIGLKQNPTNGRRFSPIFLCIGHFSE